MRVAMIGTFGMRPKMTMSRRALPLARALARRGHRVTIIVPPWDCPADAGRAALVDNVEIVNTDVPPMTPGVWYAQVTASLLRATIRQRPDVVHAFKPKGFSGMALATLLAAKTAGAFRGRLILDTDDWEGRGGWNAVNPYPAWQRWLFVAQEEGLLRTAEAVTVASRALAQLAAARRGSRTVYYLPNGVSEEQCAPAHALDAAAARRMLAARHAFEGQRPLLLLYTRFVEYTLGRLADLLRAIGRAVPGATLLVVGTGLLGQEQELAALAQRQDVGLRMALAGWIEQQELPCYFAAADVALFPMDDTLLNRTKCPMKLVDLLAAGVPVVAECVGQAAEYIEDGVSGITVMPGDHDAFAAAVARLVASPDERARLRHGASARMAERFSWDTLAETAERAYRSHLP